LKIKGTCQFCTREFFAEQVIESGGRCPWCGRSFQKDYAAVLVDALRTAEASGHTLENALEKIAEMHPWMEIDRSSVMATIEAYLDAVTGKLRQA
jgi:hypothetical protein